MNELLITLRTPFTFTGKERDEETGYSYFGARYYDSGLPNIFLSVDPMSDKYHNMSPYAYCAWNPVRLVDPDGREIDDYFSFNGKYIGSDNAETKNVRVIRESNWNHLNKDENGLVDHDEGYSISMSFSDASKAGMSSESQLKVYNYYNTTDYPVVQSADDGKKSSTVFQTVVGYKDEKTTIRLEVFLQNNIRKKICDNADEIVNSFVHEGDHISKAEQMGYHEYTDYQKKHRGELEKSALGAQMSHSSWFGTRNAFKHGVIKYVNDLK